MAARIDFSKKIKSVHWHGMPEQHQAWINVRNGQVYLTVGNGSGQAPCEPTLEELRFLIVNLNRAADLMQQHQNQMSQVSEGQ